MARWHDRWVFAQELSTTTFAVLDVETTGLDPKVDRVVEFACLRVSAGTVLERFASLVDPERAIPGRASDVHGIFDRDVAGAPTLAELAPRIRALTRDAVVVAHNARFDASFLPMLAGCPTLCTMRMARRFVDAPSYRNETLRAFLQLETARPHARAHRAEADTDVTAALLLELLRRYERVRSGGTVADLLATIARPTRLDRFAFGMHRGKRVAHVPTGYLRWIVASDFESWPDVRHTALIELVRRGCAASSA
jgi:DNA polymerase-3 subunit epsilon